MSNRSPRSELSRWRIIRIRGTPAEELGTVEAPDPETAIKEAIRLYGITEPWEQERLAARRLR